MWVPDGRHDLTFAILVLLHRFRSEIEYEQVIKLASLCGILAAKNDQLRGWLRDSCQCITWCIAVIFCKLKLRLSEGTSFRAEADRDGPEVVELFFTARSTSQQKLMIQAFLTKIY